MDLQKILIEFVITFLIIYLIYYFLIIKKCKKNKNYVPAEVNLVLTIHRIDYHKIDLYKMVKVVSLVTVFILSVIITLISNFFDNTIIILIFGTLVSIVVAFIFYNLIGSHFKKKSLERNNKKARK